MEIKEKSRILALDFGEKRIGIAISDPLGLTAQPVCTLERQGKKKDLKTIKKIIEEKNVKKLFIGLPMRLDGSKGTIYEKVKKFGRALEALCRQPVGYLDEKFTTEDAEAVLKEAGIPREKRKQVIDMMAAQLILQRHLDSEADS